jgi:hypothetical protein
MSVVLPSQMVEKRNERIMDQKLYCLKRNTQAINNFKHKISYSDTIEILTEIFCVKTKENIDIFVAFLFLTQIVLGY